MAVNICWSWRSLTSCCWGSKKELLELGELCSKSKSCWSSLGDEELLELDGLLELGDEELLETDGLLDSKSCCSTATDCCSTARNYCSNLTDCRWSSKKFCWTSCCRKLKSG